MFARLKALWKRPVEPKAVLEDDHLVGVIGEHCFLNDTDGLIDATDPSSRPFNPLFMKHIGFLPPEDVHLVNRLLHT